jgi:hypothetical protein
LDTDVLFFLCIEAVKFVKEFVQETPEFRNHPEKIIEGWGWDHMSWDEKVWPTAVRLNFFNSYPYPLGLTTARRLSSIRNLPYATARSYSRARTDTLYGCPQL